MPKRRVSFEDPAGEGGEEEEPRPPRKRAVAVGGPGSRFSGKPSLDSDEEEEEEEEEDEGCGKYELLAPHGLEGQEAGPAEGEGEGGVPLTPFNLEEELGEGRFDSQGHFLPRGGARPPDRWLESLEGMPIKPRPPPARAAEAEAEPPSPPPLPPLLRGVLELLRPGETLELLAELADGLVARGLFGVFQETRERLGGRLRALGGDPQTGGDPQSGGDPPQSGGGDPQSGGEEPPQGAPALDIFAPEEEEEEGGGPLPEVLWEYKWEHGGDPRLYGPFSSAQMQEWAAQGYFRGGARCRRVHPQGPFYDCARVDFQLYT